MTTSKKATNKDKREPTGKMVAQSFLALSLVTKSMQSVALRRAVAFKKNSGALNKKWRLNPAECLVSVKNIKQHSSFYYSLFTIHPKHRSPHPPKGVMRLT